MEYTSTARACPDCGSDLLTIPSPMLTWELGNCDQCNFTWVITPGEGGVVDFSRLKSEGDGVFNVGEH